MQIEIYSKDMCGQCNQAKALLKQKCYDYVEHILGKDATIQDLQKRAADANSNKPLRSAPQIFVDGEHIGEFKDFQAFLSDKEAVCEKAA
jgi:glutaredoxin